MTVHFFARSAAFALGLMCHQTSVSAQDSPSSQEIIEVLAPKPPLKTRSLKPVEPQLSLEDKAFIDSLRAKTRSISVLERKKIKTVVEASALPSIDLEIYFDFDSSAISSNAVSDLVKLGQALSSDQLKGYVYLLGGHTDAKGADEYNQGLSEQRALAVRDFLQQNFGVPTGLLVAAGFGEESLKNAALPDAAENRRVQIVRLSE
jgi:outer membrane protein OmpA-like peptidoglycan-associated protein